MIRLLLDLARTVRQWPPHLQRQEGTHTIQVVYGDDHTDELSASRIFINTGSTPRCPSIEGAAKSSYVYDSETLMSLHVLPKRLIIIGGGYIGMEFASMYTSFGSKVTVLQNGSVFLPREDAEIGDAVLKRLNELGAEIFFCKNRENYGCWISRNDTAAASSIIPGFCTVLPPKAWPGLPPARY